MKIVLHLLGFVRFEEVDLLKIFNGFQWNESIPFDVENTFLQKKFLDTTLLSQLSGFMCITRGNSSIAMRDLFLGRFGHLCSKEEKTYLPMERMKICSHMHYLNLSCWQRQSYQQTNGMNLDENKAEMNFLFHSLFVRIYHFT